LAAQEVLLANFGYFLAQLLDTLFDEAWHKKRLAETHQTGTR